MPNADDVMGSDLALPPGPDLDDAASWLARTGVSIDDLRTYLVKLPLSRVYAVVDECRRRAKIWGEIATALEDRARGSASNNRKP
jgi:hypothetical protein